MVDSETPTLRQFQVPLVLIIGASENLLGLLSEAALAAQVLVTECSVPEAINTATHMRPLVLVMSEETHQVGPVDFGALARDIRAELFVVPASLSSASEIEAQLKKLMGSAESQRPSWPGELGDD